MFFLTSLLQLRVITVVGGLLVVGGVVCNGFWAVVVVENDDRGSQGQYPIRGSQ
jgi:hypothetical protein